MLFANRALPVLLLAFTNHALDHILRAIHDAGVTEDFVRLGSRSKDEVVSKFNLETQIRAQDKTQLNKIVGRNYRDLKEIEEVSFLPATS